MREKTWRVPKDVVRVCLHQCDKLHLHVSEETTPLFHGGMSVNSVNATGKRQWLWETRFATFSPFKRENAHKVGFP